MQGKLVTFLIGLVLGVAGTVVLPRFVGPLLPAGLRSTGEAVEGVVVKRQREGERLLLTINTPQGAALATFTEQVAEIDLLVEEGDAVTLSLGAYEPFVDNPPIRAVKKAEPGPAATPAAAGAPAAEGPAVSQPAAGDADPAPAAELPFGEDPGVEPELEEYPGDDGDG